ncbi:uncharacterized protein B0I36DRAFT_335688 [Microdochium trichocladiopsis]|uniref:Uncharacterized protein n=1 Tax=Microdochium trichocladiopsis TaxID=1682393 RepID=A0A9P8XUT0_9PEZI|nr:uncharacterized protein B0I36DRAFT_335688 [Microdochium trichocladiopsis]KAH7018296.1 hypothetical protein B0I36DRAFT_335688 [Microdochium trichocladiopsis]
MTKLPLKVQVAIRDQWDKDDCVLQNTLKKLREVIGVEIVVDPEWQLLFAELDTAYNDKAQFVADVVSCVFEWANALVYLAEKEDYSDWAEKLLDKAKGRIRLYLEVGKRSEPLVEWSEERASFVIELCKPPIPNAFSLQDMLTKQLLQCFEKKTLPVTPAHRPAAQPGDEWADVEVDTETGKPAVVERTPVSRGPLEPPSRAQWDVIPEMSTLPRPDELLLKPPYHLTVTSSNSRFVEVQCSHSPTLQFLAEYLKKWCKTNTQDSRKPPSVEVKLYQSAFGLGLNYDRLTLESEARWNIYTATPMLVLSLVEGTLGYQPVRSEDGRWVFRRDVELRKGR